MKINAAFEGGGVRGIAYVGAISAFEQAGFGWRRLAGTSAGAIVASLLAVGLEASDIYRLLDGCDFRRFVDRRFGRWPFDLVFRCGANPGRVFEEWMHRAVGGRAMGEVAAEELRIQTFDVRNRELVTISNLSHPELPIARAVRMSMAIPLFFEPVRWVDGNELRICVDGGLVDNFPVDTFDCYKTERTVGFCLEERPRLPDSPGNAVELMAEIFSAARDAQAKAEESDNADRIVRVSDGGIHWLNFSLSPDQKSELVANGYAAARSFLTEQNPFV